MLDHFNTNFLNVLESHAPIKTVRIRPRCCPFVDTEIKELMRSRDGLLRNARRTGMPLDWELYRDLREEVKTKLRLGGKRIHTGRTRALSEHQVEVEGY